MFRRRLPDGYSIQTTGFRGSEQVAAFWNGKQVHPGTYVDIYGYGAAVRKARRVIFAHNRHRVDRTGDSRD